MNFRNSRKFLTLLTFGCPAYHRSQVGLSDLYENGIE